MWIFVFWIVSSDPHLNGRIEDLLREERVPSSAGALNVSLICVNGPTVPFFASCNSALFLRSAFFGFISTDFLTVNLPSQVASCSAL